MSANSVVLALLAVGVVGLIGWSLFDGWRTGWFSLGAIPPKFSFPQILTLLLLAASLFVIHSKQYESSEKHWGLWNNRHCCGLLLPRRRT